MLLGGYRPFFPFQEAAHGGFDPGKVGGSGTLEKDINLQIACKLRYTLEQQGIQVVMTRTEDAALGGDSSGTEKNADLKRRVEIMNASGAVLAVSIHQNSFTQAQAKGAQVFYHESSEKGKQLATQIQESLLAELKDGNHRVPKSNTSYYILRNTQCPIVIVECGFLSNPEEELLLQEEDYQEKIAKGIGKGIQSALLTP